MLTCNFYEKFYRKRGRILVKALRVVIFKTSFYRTCCPSYCDSSFTSGRPSCDISGWFTYYDYEKYPAVRYRSITTKRNSTRQHRCCLLCENNPTGPACHFFLNWPTIQVLVFDNLCCAQQRIVLILLDFDILICSSGSFDGNVSNQEFLTFRRFGVSVFDVYRAEQAQPSDKK